MAAHRSPKQKMQASTPPQPFRETGGAGEVEVELALKTDGPGKTRAYRTSNIFGEAIKSGMPY